MKASLNWLNALLAPVPPLSADRVEEALTFAGLPVESREDVRTADGTADTRLDVEVTSNRGDCLCHAGLARELRAAMATSGQEVGAAAPAPTVAVLAAGEVAQSVGGLRLEVASGAQCPRFTLRVIRGVRIGPSPAWMQQRLEAIGQRPINNVVDCTNYVLHELGSPSHVFDLGSVRGGRVVVRPAAEGEKLGLLDGRSVTLRASDVVVADGERALSLAGVMGGAESAVSAGTTDVLLEVATWNPVLVRGTARRLGLRTDSSFRFERVVMARTIDAVGARLVELILQTAGGLAEPGVLEARAAGACDELAPIALRPDRVRAVLGWPVSDERIVSTLAAQGISARPGGGGGVLLCRGPEDRSDLRVEIDLIEEVARTIGYGAIPQPETMSVRVAGPQSDQMAVRELARVLTGTGFFETVTFSFVSGKQAKPFTRAGTRTVSVSDERRGADGVCRPSVLPSLLECRRVNQANRAVGDGEARLYELSSTFAEPAADAKGGAAGGASGTPSLERRVLALLADLPLAGAKDHERRQSGLRLVRGVLDELVGSLRGPEARVTVEPGVPDGLAGFDPGATGTVMVDGEAIGVLGLVAPAVRGQFELAGGAGAVACELDLPLLIRGYPPRRRVRALPVFPAIDRDLSLIVDEGVRWGAVAEATAAAAPKHLRGIRFVGTYRGKPIPDGKKSVTLAMEFRDDGRTLRDDEVNEQVANLVGALGRAVGATLRQ